MTRAQFRSWLKQQLAWLDSTADPGFDLEEVAEEVADLIQECARHAAPLGLPQCVSACTHTRSVGEARRILSACLAGLDQPGDLSVRDAAARLKIRRARVIELIRCGKLPATNVGKKRDKYRVSVAALETFLQQGASVPGRRRTVLPVVREYY